MIILTVKKNKKDTIENLSIKDIGNPSIVEILMLQILLRHGKPVVRHILYNEIMEFLLLEKKKISEDIGNPSIEEMKDNPEDAGKFHKYLGSKKTFSSSSLYYSLDNLEAKGLVKYKRDKNKKVETVDSTDYTGILIDTILKHLIKFGLLEAQQNIKLPNAIEKVLKSLSNKKLDSLLYVWFKNYVSTEYIDFFPNIAEHLFLLSKKPVFDNAVKLGLENIQLSTLFRNTIREPNDFFDAVIIPFHRKDANINGMTKKSILKEAFRVINENGVVIIHGFPVIPDIEHALLQIFTKWIKDNYREINYYTKEEFEEELLKAGAKEVDILIKDGFLFGIGKK